MMPGNNSSPALSMRRKLSRISCLTVLDTQPLWRSSLRLVGRTPTGSMYGKSPGGSIRLNAADAGGRVHRAGDFIVGGRVQSERGFGVGVQSQLKVRVGEGAGVTVRA